MIECFLSDQHQEHVGHLCEKRVKQKINLNLLVEKSLKSYSFCFMSIVPVMTKILTLNQDKKIYTMKLLSALHLSFQGCLVCCERNIFHMFDLLTDTFSHLGYNK